MAETELVTKEHFPHQEGVHGGVFVEAKEEARGEILKHF